jgi:hypothetical protein
MVKRVSLTALRKSISSAVKIPIKNEDVHAKNEKIHVKNEVDSIEETRMTATTDENEVKKRKRYGGL